MNEAEREELVRRFREHLEDADRDTDRETNGAVDADAGTSGAETDLFDLFTELAALRNEVRLESRQLKSALDTFGEVFETLRGANARLLRELDERRAVEHAAERRAAAEIERPLLLEILELHDRTAAGLEAARAYRPRGLARLGGDGARLAASLAEGMAISLRRIDELLASRGVRPVAALGEPLDPHLMRAAAVERDATRPDGVVLGELRRGYRRGEAVLRLAEVIVNRSSKEMHTS